MSVRGNIVRCGLIGENLGKSRFADGLDLLCGAHGLELDFQFIDSAGRPDFNFEGTLETCRDERWTGVSVTHPYKRRSATWLGPALDDTLKRIAACNLVIFDEDGARGGNSDYTGFLSAWREAAGDASPGLVAMAGAGGVARALGHGLANLGAVEILVWDRDPALARGLTEAIGPVAKAVPIEALPGVLTGVDGMVNATPLGMHAYPGSAFPLPLPVRPRWVFDAVYTPVETSFVKAAREAGADVISGFDLFRHMLQRSFHAYSGIAPDAQHGLAGLDALRPEE